MKRLTLEELGLILQVKLKNWYEKNRVYHLHDLEFTRLSVRIK